MRVKRSFKRGELVMFKHPYYQHGLTLVVGEGVEVGNVLLLPLWNSSEDCHPKLDSRGYFESHKDFLKLVKKI